MYMTLHFYLQITMNTYGSTAVEEPNLPSVQLQVQYHLLATIVKAEIQIHRSHAPQ